MWLVIITIVTIIISIVIFLIIVLSQNILKDLIN